MPVRLRQSLHDHLAAIPRTPHLLSIPEVLLRRETSRDTELLVLRHDPAPPTRQTPALPAHGPAPAQRPVQTHPPPPVGVNISRHTSDTAVLAPHTHRPKMGLHSPTHETRPTSDTHRDPPARPAACHREQPMGTPHDPRRTHPTRPHRRRSEVDLRVRCRCCHWSFPAGPLPHPACGSHRTGPPRPADIVHVIFGVAGLVSARTEGGAHQHHLTERFPGITGRVRLHHGTGGYRGRWPRGSGLGPGRVEDFPGPNGTATVRSRREMLRDKSTSLAVALALPDLSVASLVADGKVSTRPTHRPGPRRPNGCHTTDQRERTHHWIDRGCCHRGRTEEASAEGYSIPGFPPGRGCPRRQRHDECPPYALLSARAWPYFSLWWHTYSNYSLLDWIGLQHTTSSANESARS
jgi:hypothetical protein